jgi:hypothetical protein
VRVITWQAEGHYLLMYELLGWDRTDLTVWVETLVSLIVLACVLAVLPNCLTSPKTQVCCQPECEPETVQRFLFNACHA